jgi:hypothetical protein
MLQKVNPLFYCHFVLAEGLTLPIMLGAVMFQSLHDFSTSLEGEMCGESEFVSLWEHLGLVELIEAVFV